MKTLRWAAVAVTALFVLMNLGATFDSEQAGWIRGFGAVAGVLGAIAAVGLARNLPWGNAAVVGVGLLNAGGAFAALIADEDGFVPGIIVAGLAITLGVLADGGRFRILTAGSSAG
jgi:hypothetical protein